MIESGHLLGTEQAFSERESAKCDACEYVSVRARPSEGCGGDIMAAQSVRFLKQT